MTEAPHTIDLEKNSREVLRLGLSEYRGHKLVQARVWYRADDGELKPGKGGFAFKVSMLDNVRDALDQLKATAQAEGLL